MFKRLLTGSGFGSKEPKNRQKRNPLTVSKRWSFRKKIIVSHVVLFFVLLYFAVSLFEKVPLEHLKECFLGFCLGVSVLFVVVMGLIVYRINLPLRQIMRVLKAYRGGENEILPKIVLGKSVGLEDDFYQLASTLNALSEALQKQIARTADERDEKESILESLDEGVVAVDAQMQVRYINSMGAKMVGVPRRVLIGNPFPKTDRLSYSELLEKCGSLLASCQVRRAALTDSISISEGRRTYLDLIAAPKAQRNGAILVLQDKSSHYRVIEMGRDFVANASHELRTPITIIKGFAETLQDLPELPREMVADITDKIVRNCQRMDTLVKNLLTLADLDNLPESRFQGCDLVTLAEACREVVLSVYENSAIAIERNQESIAVYADPDILELAIINLLDNAAKYSNPPAQICIRISQEGEEVKIEIADQGIGIPPLDLEHIFERFYTVDKARSRRLGGAGLGLSIVRTIIEKHHGSISVRSQIGEGTTFTVVLPALLFTNSFAQ